MKLSKVTKSILFLALTALLFNTIVDLILSPAAQAMPARVLIIRHGEKPDDDTSEDLAPKGYQRAQALTHLFQQQPELLVGGTLAAIYASKYIAGEDAQRCFETATPLAQALGLPLQTTFMRDQETALAQEIMSQSSYDGRTVMIVWTRSHMQALADAFRARPRAKWGKQSFDRIWVLDFSSRGVARFQDLPEQVLPGDSN